MRYYVRKNNLLAFPPGMVCMMFRTFSLLEPSVNLSPRFYRVIMVFVRQLMTEKTPLVSTWQYKSCYSRGLTIVTASDSLSVTTGFSK